ncbi:LuxR family transcriptional regulator [Bradyrhizobium prioriisuperbiae]|uniref:helix-turn-helix transcriptional regulator n=1 Tax=Bradyrhizobium prioriisuperbiae TaxID=2854389 RepID=UPI0028EBBDC6|nr:LuxR family transcriptional regulator [Bradyrhizobium prioritasuperba]
MANLADPHLGRRVLEFIDAAEVATLPQQVMTLFEAAVGEFGFHAYIMAGIPTSDVSLDRVTLANGWPAEWFDVYVRDNLCAVDPIPRHALTTVQPFLWSEARYDRDTDSGARGVMERALDFRFNSGFCIPIHYDASTAAVSMAGDRPYITDETKRALHIIGLYSHSRIRSLGHKPARSLSNNEAEVLRWAAVGKTAWETSVIMNIGERKVRFLLTEAQRKLNAANRTAAVVQALVKGEIKL